MKKRILTNAFSLNMVGGQAPYKLHVLPISLEDARDWAPRYESAVGHPDTAAVFSDQLGIPVPMNRVTVALSPGDQLLVGQYKGPRLPEGAKTLPEGATIEWLMLEVAPQEE